MGREQRGERERERTNSLAAVGTGKVERCLVSVEVVHVDVDTGVKELAHLLDVVVACCREDLVLVHQVRHLWCGADKEV